MADVNSSAPTLDETTDKAGNNDTSVSTTNTGDSFAVEGTGKYGDMPVGGGNQNSESTGQSEDSGGARPI